MKSKYKTGNFSPIAKSFEYMKKEYGITTNQARSMYFKTKKDLLRTNYKGASVFSTKAAKEIGNTDYITYQVITGQTNINAIDEDFFFQQTIDKFTHSKDAGLDIPDDKKRPSFVDKYGNNEEFKKIWDKYLETKDYETFKDELEEFKKHSTEYLIGSP